MGNCPLRTTKHSRQYIALSSSKLRRGSAADVISRVSIIVPRDSPCGRRGTLSFNHGYQISTKLGLCLYLLTKS